MNVQMGIMFRLESDRDSSLDSFVSKYREQWRRHLRSRELVCGKFDFILDSISVLLETSLRKDTSLSIMTATVSRCFNVSIFTPFELNSIFHSAGFVHSLPCHASQ